MLKNLLGGVNFIVENNPILDMGLSSLTQLVEYKIKAL